MFEYIVIGAGSSGCVVAARLSEKGARVLLLEAGGPDSSAAIRDPFRWPSLIGSEFDWKYITEREPQLGNRRIEWPRGKCLGGSGSIHAMVYIRGHRSDFDRWRALGNAGWSYEEVLPYFLKSEHNQRGASRFHGSGGPLWVADSPALPPDRSAFLEAAADLGYQADPQWDFNGERQEGGAGLYQRNIREGLRHSSASAFLAPAMGRSNLVVRPHAQVVRILWEGTRAAGVEYALGGERFRPRCAREVILCAGVVDSPKLLMLSGVGPADHLRSQDLAVVADLPGVGENLQDHPRLSLRYAAKRRIPAVLSTAGLFLRSPGAASAPAPDLQFYLGTRPIESEELSITLTLGRPASTGTIRLRSADPGQPAVIRANYFRQPEDLRAVVEGIKLARTLCATRAFDGLRGEEIAPGAAASSAGEIGAYVRRAATTIFHGTSSCSMGSDRMSVVDARLRVYGVDNLRVVDASIMPDIVNGNPNAACVMIGEKGADLILQDSR